MGESFQALSWIQDFEADFPQKVSLKMLNQVDFDCFSNLFSVHLWAIDHLSLKLLIVCGHTASLNIWISKVQYFEILNFHPCNHTCLFHCSNLSESLKWCLNLPCCSLVMDSISVFQWDLFCKTHKSLSLCFKKCSSVSFFPVIFFRIGDTHGYFGGKNKQSIHSLRRRLSVCKQSCTLHNLVNFRISSWNYIGICIRWRRSRMIVPRF